MNALLTLAQCLGLGTAFTLALVYFGLGATFFLLPPGWREWRIWVMPFVGLALIVIWDYIVLFFGLNLTVGTYLLLVVVTVLNGAAIWRWRAHDLKSTAPLIQGRQGTRSSPALFRSVLAPDECQRRLRAEVLLPLAIAVLTFAVAIAPLLRYGYLTVIGENWDYEFYLPLADYLKTYTVEQLVHAPSNPLLPIVTGKFIGRLPMGFSYLHATMDILWNVSALDSYAVLIALVRALGILSAFVFFRLTLKMSARAALFASALYAASGLLLWTSYWGFGLQLASMALLPLTLALCTHALLTREVHALPIAALLLAALNVTFHPTLIAALLPLGPLGLYVLVTQPGRIKTLFVGASLLVLAAGLSFPALFHIRDFIREFYVLVRLGFGVREFIPISDGLGVSLYALDIVVGQTIATPWLYDLATRLWDVTALPLTVLALGLIVLALVRLWPQRERRVVWYLSSGGYLAYILILRLPFLHAYPYGFFKALSLVIFINAALLAEGLEQLPGLVAQWLPFPRARQLQALLGAVLLAANLFVLGIMLEQYFKPAPSFFDADALTVRAVPQQIPRGASVFLTDRAEVQKIPMGLVSYALRDFPLFGKVETGYGELNNATPGAVYDYALLARGQDPTGYGYQTKPLWSNQILALYAQAPGVVYHRTLSARAIPSGTLTFTLGANTVVTGTKTVSTTVAVRGVRIALAAFVPQVVNFNLGRTQTTVSLVPGLAVYEIPQAQLPGQLRITVQNPTGQSQTPGGKSPRTDISLFVPWIELRAENEKGIQPSTSSPGQGSDALAISPSNALLVRCANGTDESLSAFCSIANPGGARLRWDYVVRGMPNGTHDDRELIRRAAVSSPRESLETDGESYLRFDNLPPAEFAATRLPDGNYRSALEIFSGDSLVGHTLVGRIDLHRFTLNRGHVSITHESPRDLSPVIIQLSR